MVAVPPGEPSPASESLASESPIAPPSAPLPARPPSPPVAAVPQAAPPAGGPVMSSVPLGPAPAPPASSSSSSVPGFTEKAASICLSISGPHAISSMALPGFGVGVVRPDDLAGARTRGDLRGSHGVRGPAEWAGECAGKSHGVGGDSGAHRGPTRGSTGSRTSSERWLSRRE